uniref:C2 domain-containing protein n=1 Tax=Trichuris muris TaxID=70415 RepID=A0A5S6QB06_TRIMR
MTEVFDLHGYLLLDRPSCTSFSSSSSLEINQAVNDASRLKPAISSDSLLSLSSTTDLSSGESECGTLAVRLGYSGLTNMLSIHLLQLHDIRLVSYGNEIWFLLFLLPHQKPLFKTKPVACAPVVRIQEQFQQCIYEKDLRRIALLCQMYTHGQTANQAMPYLVSQARIRLRDVALMKSSISWLVLSSADKNSCSAKNGEHVGDVLFSLAYSPAAQRLTVIVMKVKTVDISGSNNPKGMLTRVYLVYGAKVLRKRTSIQHTEAGCAQFNESMIFSVSRVHLSKVYLRVSVREAHSLTEFTTIGHVTVGARCSGKEFGHWQRMIDNPTVPMTMWHKLLAKPSHRTFNQDASTFRNK